MSKIKNRPKSFEILVAGAVNNFPVGWHRSLLKGSGDEFESIRPWQPGDKRVAMAVSAKTGEIMAKVFQEPKRINIWLVLDVSRSMVFGGQKSAVEAAAVIAAAFALSAKKAGDPVGVITFDNQVRWFFPLSETLGVKEIGRRLLTYEPPRAKTNLSVALQQLVDRQSRNSLIVLISDFLFPLSKDDINLLRQLGSFSDVSVLALALNQGGHSAKLEQHFMLTIEDSETTESVLWAGSSALADLFKEAETERRQKLKRLLGMSGTECLMMNINNNYIRRLSRHFWQKRRHRV